MAEQNLEILEKMDNLSKAVRESILRLAGDTGEYLETIRDENKAHYKVTLDAISELNNKVVAIENLKAPPSQPVKASSTAAPTRSVPTTTSSSHSSQPLKPKTEYQKQPKILFVSDSVGRVAQLSKVEKATKCTLRSAKAYSSVEDSEAVWPEKNFAKVVEKEISNSPTDCLIMSAPTVDITNIDTASVSENESTVIYQEAVYNSCLNMFKTAETTLRENLCLKKVIIMEHFPRYDTKDADPQQIKTKLAKYANNVLAQIWLNSPYRNKILIGQHNVEVGEFGIKHDEAFKNDKRYDGVHFDGKSGPNIYNKSLIHMIRKALFNESLKSSQEQLNNLVLTFGILGKLIKNQTRNPTFNHLRLIEIFQFIPLIINSVLKHNIRGNSSHSVLKNTTHQFKIEIGSVFSTLMWETTEGGTTPP